MSREFKEGDMVAITEECGALTPGIYLEVVNNPYASNVLFVTTGSGICTLTKHWRLISPKERTIDQVEVGDTVECETYNDLDVLAVSGKLLAYWCKGSNEIQWIEKKKMMELGWKIKQPEPEKEEEKDYHFNTENYETVPCPDGKPGCLVMHYKSK